MVEGEPLTTIQLKDAMAAARIRITLSEEGLDKTKDLGELFLLKRGISTNLGVVYAADAIINGRDPRTLLDTARVNLTNPSRREMRDFWQGVEITLGVSK